MDKTIRWQQRYQNLIKAFSQLDKGLQITNPSDIETQGIIKSFEFTFELAWKTLKDYLESQNIAVKFPRDVIKSGFQYEILADGECWMQMLEKRNEMAHTYDEKLALDAYQLIKTVFFEPIQILIQFFKSKL